MSRTKAASLLAGALVAVVLLGSGGCPDALLGLLDAANDYTNDSPPGEWLEVQGELPVIEHATATPDALTWPEGTAVLACGVSGPAPLVANWSQVSGPQSVALSQLSDEPGLEMQLTFSEPGTYEFELTVTNPYGSVTRTVTVVVHSASSEEEQTDDDDAEEYPVFVEVTDPDTAVAALFAPVEGEYAAIMADKDDAGDPVQVTGINYLEQDGSSWTIYLGDDGLPSTIVIEDWVVGLGNYTDQTVDLAIKGPDGETTVHTGVAIDAESAARLQEYAADGLVGAADKEDALKSATGGAKLKWSKVWEVGGAVLGTVGCGAGVAAAVSGTIATSGVAAPVAYGLVGLGCAGAVGAWVNVFVEDESLGWAGTGVNVVTCGGAIATADPLGVGTSCGGLVTDAIARLTADDATAEEYLVNVESGALLTITPVPAKPAVGQDVTVTVTVFPPQADAALEYEVSGTDAYYDAGTILTDSAGVAEFFVPGTMYPDVTDTVTVRWPAQGIEDVATYSFTDSTYKPRSTEQRHGRATVTRGTRVQPRRVRP